MSDLVDSLRAVPLFANLSKKDLQGLADSMHERRFAAGDEVVVEGQGGIGFFVVLDGHARVTVHGEDRGTIGPGEYFGEMAVIDGGARSATVRAEDDVRCGAITAWSFRPFVREHPDVAWALLTTLVKLVRASDARQPAAS
jgi:CRP/FNR family transcriptional regulator, cyclic AMP receptor protein